MALKDVWQPYHRPPQHSLSVIFQRVIVTGVLPKARIARCYRHLHRLELLRQAQEKDVNSG